MHLMKITGGSEKRFTHPTPWVNENGVEEHASLEHTITAKGSIVEDEYVDEITKAAKKAGLTVTAEPYDHVLGRGWVKRK